MGNRGLTCQMRRGGDSAVVRRSLRVCLVPDLDLFRHERARSPFRLKPPCLSEAASGPFSGRRRWVMWGDAGAQRK